MFSRLHLPIDYKTFHLGYHEFFYQSLWPVSKFYFWHQFLHHWPILYHNCAGNRIWPSDIKRTQYSLPRPQKHGHVVNTQGIQIEPKPENQFNPRLEWYRNHGKMPSVKKRFGIFSPLKQSPTRKISQQDMTSTRYCSLFQFLVLSSVCKCWAWKFDGKNREWAYLSI